MSKIKVSSVTKGQPPCPGPAPKPIPMSRPAPTDAPRPFPPPPPFFMPGPCCPSATQVVDNITVQSLDPEKIDVVEGTYLGMKAFGIDAKTFEGIGTTGMVPMPKEGDEGKVLTSNGEWSEFVVELPQSDWKQEDSEQPDYIKNKPGEYAGSDAGLVPSGTVADQEKFLRGDGKWATVITDMPDFVGATENEDGVRGVVPAPQAGDQTKFLCGDGTWAVVSAGDSTRECTVNEMNSWLDEADREANNG